MLLKSLHLYIYIFSSSGAFELSKTAVPHAVIVCVIQRSDNRFVGLHNNRVQSEYAAGVMVGAV